ncbi:MAG: Ig-like domain-containing protein [bacterium]|nr:MAG: Ig-like domain-containing protein [bacterium]
MTRLLPSFPVYGRWAIVMVVLFSLLLPLACGGGGGGGGEEEPPPVTVPTVISTIPTDGADQVPNDTDVIINFSEAMNPTSVVTGLNVASHSGTITAVWEVGNARVTLSFDPLLLEGTHYVVTLASSVLDAEGTSLASAYSFSFDTGTIPIADIVSPSPGQTNVGLDPVVSISFSEPMDTNSVAGNFGVSGYPGSLIFTWGDNGNGMYSSLDVSFATSLTPDTTYTASLLPFAEDAEGTPLGVSHQRTFSTGGALATGAIQGVISDDPQSNFDNNLEETIVALFDHNFIDTEGPQPVLASADAGGAYHFSYLSPGNYWVLALQDSNGDGITGGDKFVETGDSAGVYSDIMSLSLNTVTVAAVAVTGISFQLLDTEAISGEVVYAGTDTTDAYSPGSALFAAAFSTMDLSVDPDYGTESDTGSSDDFDSATKTWNYAINAYFGPPGFSRMDTGHYYIGAYIDLNGNSNFDPDKNLDGDFDDGEPAGLFPTAVPILATGQDAVGIDITAYDTITAFGQVEAVDDTTTLSGSPYAGATVTLLDYPLQASSGSSGEFLMSFVPIGRTLALHVEPQAGSVLFPYNTGYVTISADHAYKPVSEPSNDGVHASLVHPDVMTFIGALCGVTINSSRAQIAGQAYYSGGGNPPIVGAEVLFAAGTVKYIDTQFNCTHTSTQDVSDGPQFFIFNVDPALFAGNRGVIAASVSGGIVDTVTVPVRGGEFTWAELED